MFKLFGFVTKLVLCAGLLFTVFSFASDWQLIGPEGGNVRSLAYDPSDPNRIILGTSAGQLFVSQDGGNSWALFSHLGPGDDYVFDHVVFDPTNSATVYAAAWGLFDDNDGGVFRSDDGGRTWRELMGVHGKSIRALAMAPSDHNTLVIGALDGVFRSRDGGATWERVSPENPSSIENHSVLKNFVSVAIDPQNPDIMYAGTRHLPWKTTNGGATWHNLKEGILDDSDVFSIIVDPKVPSRVYASACSGIYKSDNGAEALSPRPRTSPFRHPHSRVEAGPAAPIDRLRRHHRRTLEDDWTAAPNGRWCPRPDVIVNDVLIDPRNPERVLLATDRRGVLVSNDGFAHYAASNRGFTHRVVGAVITDRKDPGRLYVGVMNDKDMGGFFISDDAGKNWRQSNRGLDERDILSLQQSESGVLFVGTNHGIFSLASLGGSWLPAKMIWGPVPEWQPKPDTVPEPVVSKSKSAKSSKTTATSKRATAVKPKVPPEPVIPLATAPRVRSLQMGEKAWFAATDQGLFISVDQGQKWYGQPIQGESNFSAVYSYVDETVTLAGAKGAWLSHDGGKTWTAVALPAYVSGVYSLTEAPGPVLWLGTGQGAMRSTDDGQSWHYVLNGLPKSDVLAVHYDPSGQRLLATALHTHGVFESKDGGQTWQLTSEARVAIRSAMNFQGHLLGASAHNGLLLEQGGAVASESARAGEASSSANRQ